jgi:beta-lactamase regulating signal transducer with metallopeptidase domain
MSDLLDGGVHGPVHALAWALLHFLWQGAVLASAFGLAMIAARRRTAHTRYVIGCATLAAMALSPASTLAWLLSPPASSPAPLPWSLSMAAAPAATPADVDVTLLVIVLAWALGAAICTAWLCGGWMQTHRLRCLPHRGLPARCRDVVDRISAAMGVRASVRLVESAAVAVPMTMGWLAPVILLPAALVAGLPAKQLEAIIAHELAHVRRFDYLVNLLQVVIESLLFYHPAVWWVSRRVRLEREYCCDDLAATVCGDRVLYARALTELEALRGASAQARLGIFSNGGSLMKRIVRLLDHQGSRPAAPARLHATLAVGALLASASTALAFLNPCAIFTHAASAQAEGHQNATDAGVTASRAYVKIALLTDSGSAVESSSDEASAYISHADARTAYIAQYLRAQSLEPALAEYQATGHVWNLVQALAPEMEKAAHEFDAMIEARRPAAWLGDATQTGEMPSEALVEVARQFYPLNLFELMPWISPAAYELILPEAEESDPKVIRLEGFSMSEDGKWVAVLRDPSSTQIQIHAESTNGELTSLVARTFALDFSVSRIMVEPLILPDIPLCRPAMTLEMSLVADVDVAIDEEPIVEDDELIVDDEELVVDEEELVVDDEEIQ